ncbi:MAG: ABC transporter ATP-binding protein [Methylovirgula sp.]|uniref:ABC transporter ATP-binding protein n=1 Tax=Methylovirgula sp. TaxID=1978224 RepID=UPI003075F981
MTMIEASNEDPALAFSRVKLAYGGQGNDALILDHVSFDVMPGQITTVVGPSGCGKTTLLRLAAGLIRASGGHVLQHGRVIDGLNTKVGFVTQESNLFPWLTTLGNVEFPLAIRGVPKKERRERAMSWLQMVGLDGFENHYPSQLSGGMQKRAAIVRTLVYEPEVVLFDEPFGALDAQTRMSLHHQLLQLWHNRRNTMFFITHDLVEAITLSDQVVVMTRRPARIKEIVKVPLKRPRNVFEIFLEPGFDETYAALWKHFKGEIKQN